ncbi:class I SAM-dependent RNA methyltransferase [Candidatus Saccharibacteria bacterium]|nr:class I SAM-dependent RNA methyltransferase [Candidatus Saccharibacteria bacterium]
MKLPLEKATEILVEKIVPGGQALGTISGKKIFLWNALPGETVKTLLLTKEKSSFLEGIALDIENPSPSRVTPKDPCYLSTSPWQIFDYSFELTEKRLLVLESLREEKIPLENLEISPVKTDGKEWHYRNKMEYSLFWDNEKNCIFPGFHVRGTHKKLKVAKSSIERPELFETAKTIISSLNSAHEPARNYQSLLLRCDQKGTVSGGLYKNHAPHPSFSPLSDSLLGKTYSYSPNGFFQINLPVYELALKEIKSYIKTEKVLDLYSGVGSIGLSVASDKSLTLVESNKDAFSELEKNCAKIKTATPVLSKSEEALSFISPEETVILDPPRAGCDKKLIEKLLEEVPEKIIYLSCNPSTQARDLKHLLKSYDIEKISPYNFFPKTPHIENLVILSRHKSI